MIDDFLVDTIAKINITKNEYGDLVFNNTATNYKGRFLNHTGIIQDSEMEEQGADAIIHIEKSAEVTKGDILLYGSDLYRVIKLVKAKRGKQTNIMFLKCYVEEHKPIEGIS